MGKVCIGIIGGGIALIVLLIIVIAIVGSSDSTTSDGPTTPPPKLTAQELLAEREANATRFDANRKGQWIAVTGNIERIDDGNVYLRGDGFISDVVLEDLSQEEQIPLNIGQDFSAVCVVGNYIIGSIYMNDCRVE